MYMPWFAWWRKERLPNRAQNVSTGVTILFIIWAEGRIEFRGLFMIFFYFIPESWLWQVLYFCDMDLNNDYCYCWIIINLIITMTITRVFSHK